MFRMIGNILYGFINLILIPLTGGVWAIVLGFVWFIKRLFGMGR